MVIEGLHNRLVKIQGQVGGIEKMVDKGASAEAILVQVNAIKSAIHKVGELILIEDVKERLAESGGDTSLARAFLFAALALGTVLQQIEEEELEEAEEA